LSSNLNYLSSLARNHTDRWYDDFNSYQWQKYINSLIVHAERLAGCSDHNLSSLGKNSKAALEQSQTGALARLYLALEPRVPTISGYDSILAQEVKKATGQIIASLIEADPNFLSDMADFYETLPQNPNAPAAGSAESFNDAYAFMARVLREKAQAVAYGQKYRSDGRKMRFWDFLSGRLDESSLAPMGLNCLFLLSLRKLNCSNAGFANAYFESLTDSYLSFRKSGPEWYTKEGIDNLYINDLELDLIILAIMESSSALLWQDYLKPGRFPLGLILQAHKKELRNQILVDEAVDFSPVQLKCLMNLTHPSCNSFYATADLNQRFTPWGAKSLADFEWAVPGLTETTLSVNYRTNAPLEELAQALAVKTCSRYSEKSDSASSCNHKPVLLAKSEDQTAVIEWLKDRILEIGKKVGKLPSIAVTINSETELGIVSEALSAALEPHNISAVAYRESEVAEEDSTIRVINLKHIKGLEFEAVFLLEMDRLVQSLPELYRQYIYTAVARAATFFGATCLEGLPQALEHLGPVFGDNWA
jgi:hypothetical protein